MLHSLPKLLNSIGVPQSNFVVASVNGCEIAVASMPYDTLCRQPFDAFVMSDVKPASPSALFKNGFDVKRYSYSADPCVREVRFAQHPLSYGASIYPIVDYDYKDDPESAIFHSAASAIFIARSEELRSLTFMLPSGIAEDEDESKLPEPAAACAMIFGIDCFLRNFDRGDLGNILIRVSDRLTLSAAIQEMKKMGWKIDHVPESMDGQLLADRDYITRVIDEFIAERTKHDCRPPRYVPYFGFAYPEPLQFRGVRDSSILPQLANPTQPAEGYVRLIPNLLLDAAFEMMPEYMRTLGEGIPPPFTFIRFMPKKTLKHGERLVGFNTIHQASFVMRNRKTGMDTIVGELGMTDVPIEAVNDASALMSTIFSNSMIVNQLDFILEHEGRIPTDVVRMIKEGCPAPDGITLSIDEIDRMLVTWILHEYAEIFWVSLPDEFKEEWAKLYPYTEEKKGDFVYYRNLLRIYLENHMPTEAEKRDFFAQESFADKLSFYWNRDLPEVIRAQGTKIAPEERAFLERVMDFARERRERYGTAFVLSE
jgi:hypothetical protein